MQSLTLSLPVDVITTSTNPYSFTNEDGKLMSGDRRQAWFLIEPGEPPLECRVADDCTDWHDVVASMGKRIVVTVTIKGRKAQTGNAVHLVGELLAAGPLDDAPAPANGRRSAPLTAKS